MEILVAVSAPGTRSPRGVRSIPAAAKPRFGAANRPRANSMLFAGGGIETGQVIGATDPRGEDVVDRRVGTGDFLATMYHHLGIDAEHVTIPDLTGRPVPIQRLAATRRGARL